MIQAPEVSNYNDFAGLQNLKSSANKDSREGITAVAEQFESLFISMMLKSMREANKGFSEGNILSSNETDFYQEMFDSQISVSLAGSSGGGIGLAEVIERQMLEAKGLSVEAQNSKNPAMSLADYPREAFPMHRSEALNKALASVERELSTAAQVSSVAFEESESTTTDDLVSIDTLAPADSEHLPTIFLSPKQFVDSLAPIAQKVEAETGISAKLMLAQSALETGWGKKPIVREDGSPSFNLFGIKANAAWQGDSTDILTTEFHAGVAVKQRDQFRAYDSYDESFADYADFLKNNPRYQAALDMKGEPLAFAQALQDSGYATDPSYADKISRIVGGRLSDIPTATQPESEVR